MPKNPKVVRPLGMGFDEKALETASFYRFKPAMMNGWQPVAVVTTVAINFQIG